MPVPPLADEVLRETLRLVRQYGSANEAAKHQPGLSRSGFEHRVAEAKRRGITLEEEAPTLPVGLPYEREWRVWQQTIGALQDRYQGPCKRPARIGRLKIVVISDLHAPFHDTAALAHICTAEADADICVVLGDLGDGYSLSRFIKYEHVSYEQELAAVTHLLERFSETWPLVRLIEGNHDSARLEKRLRDQLPQDFITAILAMTGGTLSPLVALARKLPNVEVAGHTTAGGRSVPWLAQIGDCLFCHAEKFSKVPGSALRGLEEWLTDMEVHLGLQPWRVVIQAHTHQLSWMPWGADKLLVECGCVCTLPGYAVGARISGRPQRTGYVTLEQVDGVTNLDSVRVHWLDHRSVNHAAPQARPA